MNKNNTVKQKLLWPQLLFFTISPALALLALCYYIFGPGISLFGVVFFAVMFFITELGITAGYHRLFSHRAYDAHWSVRLFFLLFGAAAFQESALRWSLDHRIHHRFVDQNRDPYSIKRGFFYAHFGWIIREPLPEAVPPSGLGRDLQADPLVMLQDRFYLPIAIFMCFGFPTLIGFAFGKPFEGFCFGGLIRMVAVHHSTFLINSAAHVFGTRPYSLKNSARDSWLLAIFTQGEGYHNFHHSFASDYRNGVSWHQWDPTKWVIYGFRCLGLAWNLRRTPEWMILRARADVKYEELKAVPDSVLSHQIEEMKLLLEQRIARFAEFKKHVQEWKVEAKTKSLARKERKRTSRDYRARLAVYRLQMKNAWTEYSRTARMLVRGSLSAR